MKSQNARKLLAKLAHRRTACLLQAAASLAFGQQVAHAATLNWDPGKTNGTAGGGTGNWDLTSSLWYNNTARVDQAWPDNSTSSASDTAVFGNTAGSVTITAAIGVNTILFNTPNCDIANGTGGSLTLLGPTPTINVNNNGSNDIASTLLGGTGFTKTGVGTLTLGNTNGTITLTNGGSINNAAGTTTLNSPVDLGAAGTINITAGTLTLKAALSGGVTGNAELGLTSGIVNLAGANTYSGIINIGTAFVSVTANFDTAFGASGTGNGTTVGNGGVVSYQNGANTTVNEPFTINGAGGSNGAIQFYGGSKLILAGATSLASDSAISMRSNLATRTDTISGGISEATTGGTSSILFSRFNAAAGTTAETDNIQLTTTASTYKGNTYITDAAAGANGNSTGTTTGTNYFYVASNLTDALPTGTVLILGGQQTISGQTIGADAGAGRLVLNGVNQTVAGLTTAGTAGALNIVAGGNATTPSTLTVNNAVNYTFSGVLGATTTGGNNLALTKTGTGTLALAGANTYTGGTTISGGTLVLTAGTTGTTNITVNNTGTLLLGANDRINDAATVILGGGTINTGGFQEGRATGVSAATAGLGALTLTTSSVLDFGSGHLGSSVLAFADSHIQTWVGTLILANFTSGTDFLNFASNSGLTAAQLSKITYTLGASTFVASGLDSFGDVTFRLVVVPEPATWLGGFLIVSGLGYSQRKRAQRRLGFARFEPVA